jgi:hypothetical protein
MKYEFRMEKGGNVLPEEQYLCAGLTIFIYDKKFGTWEVTWRIFGFAIVWEMGCRMMNFLSSFTLSCGPVTTRDTACL